MLLAVGAAALALAGAGCGPPPPQAPTAQADRLSDSLSQIAQDCGEAYQVGAFAPGSRDLKPLESDALSRVHELAGVYEQNPNWIYQGATVHQIVALAVTYLRQCHLYGAATELVNRTR